MSGKNTDLAKKGFKEYVLKFYIDKDNNGLEKEEDKKIQRIDVPKDLSAKLKKGVLEKEKKADSREDGIERNIEKKIQEEINRAVKGIAENLEFEVTVEEVPELLENKKDNQEKEIRIRYATGEQLEVNYAEIFSYLNTKPNLIQYEYEFTEKKERDGGELTPRVIAKLNQIKRLEKVLYSRDLKYQNPEGVDPKVYEVFRIFSNTTEGFVMNMFYYDAAFAAPV